MKKIIRTENGVTKVITINDKPTRTQQQFKDEVDMNNIIAKYHQTGQVTHLARKAGAYTDLSNVSDYQKSMQMVIDAQNAFDTLPAKLRARFGNDPAQLLAFMGDKNNYDEGVKLGLLEPKSTPPPSAPSKTNE